jgi:ABC-type bacteriocin/lantibiotic exporter with double-glycine peptidase domain
MANSLDAGAGLQRTPELDGLNSLYVYMQLLEHPIPRETVRRQLDELQRQPSFEDLRLAADRLGAPSAICRANPTMLSDLPKPAIVHLESDQAEGGNFGILVDTDEFRGTALLLDMGRVSFVELGIDALARRWSGYAMVLRPPTVGPSAASGALIGIAISAAGMRLGLIGARAKERRRREFA